MSNATSYFYDKEVQKSFLLLTTRKEVTTLTGTVQIVSIKVYKKKMTQQQFQHYMKLVIADKISSCKMSTVKVEVITEDKKRMELCPSHIIELSLKRHIFVE